MPEKRGVKSEFTEYVKFLPLELLPTFWNEDERALLTGTTLAPALSAKVNSLYREYENLRTATSSIGWCNSCWWDEVDGILSFTDWMHVDAMYRSRALEFPGIGDCMVPCIDMANHSSGDSTMAIYEVDRQGNAVLVLREGKTVTSGGEISITYGDAKGACEMIFSYGFIEDSMTTAKELFLGLSMPEDDPLAKAKLAVADTAPGFKIVESGEAVQWEGDYIWLICVNEEDGLQFAIAQTVDGEQELKAFWQDEPMPAIDQFRAVLEHDQKWPIYQLRAVNILQDRVAQQLESLYGSDEEVSNTPHGTGTNVRDRPFQLATKLRSLEADLLEKMYASLDDQVCLCQKLPRVIRADCGNLEE